MQTNSNTAFNPSKLNFTQFKVLGTGLWGTVLDLNDGTVLKLARRYCAGIGDGLEKIDCESKVLSSLCTVLDREPLIIPKEMGSGHLESENTYLDHSLWLRTTKAPGEIRTASQLRHLDADSSRLISESIALALNTIHKRLKKSNVQELLPKVDQKFALLQHEFNSDPEVIALIQKLMKIESVLSDKPLIAIHGDFNISNLLFCESTVTAALDFAETRMGFAEEDIAAIISELPNLKDDLIETFQKVSGNLISNKLLDFSLAMRNLYTFIISSRLGEPGESQLARTQLEKFIFKYKY